MLKYIPYTLLASLLLSACGGDDPPPKEDLLVFNGVAATGYAMALADVTVKCANGKNAVTSTNVKGEYSITMPTGSALPCVLRANNANGNLFTALDTFDGASPVNINQLTDLKFTISASQSASLYFDTFNGKFISEPKNEKLNTAENEIKELFKSKINLSTINNFTHDTLIAAVQGSETQAGLIGNAYDTSLDSLNALLKSYGFQWSNVAQKMLLEQGSNKTISGSGLRLSAILWSGSTTSPVNPNLPNTPVSPPSPGGDTIINPIGTSKTAQSISFTTPSTLLTSSGSYTLTPTATSGLPVIVSSTTPEVCNVSKFTLSLISPGTCNLIANQLGNSTFAAAPQVTAAIAVMKSIDSIVFPSISTQNVGQSITLIATSTAGLPVTVSSTSPTVCSISGKIVTTLSAGTCTLTASTAASQGYNAASVNMSFTVSVTNQSITFVNPGNKTLKTPTFAINATSSSNLPVSIIGTTPSICNINGNIVLLIQTGTCTVTASQLGNAGYLPATPVTISFGVSKESQTINISTPTDIILTMNTVSVNIAASSGLPVTTVSQTPGICTLSENTLYLLAKGNCLLSSNQAGDSIYLPAVTTTKSIEIKETADPII